MQFERLRNSHKKQIIIGAIAVCVIGGILTFATSRAFYRVDDSIDLAKGTINYKAYDFKIMAMYKSEDGTNYTEIADRMPSSGYVINEEKSYCTIDNKVHDTNTKLYTYQGKHVFENLAKNNKCYLYFDKKELTGSETILTNLGTSIKTDAPDFSVTATTDEGVYAVSDDMYNGTSYYWRGAVTNNYVIFAGKCWRIVRINGDGSIRLIYDGTTCHANEVITAESIAKTDIVYNTSSTQSNYVGWTYTGKSQRTLSGTPSNAKSELEIWYSTNIIGTNVDKVVTGKYCNDREASGWAINGSSNFNYVAYNKIKAGTPTLSCSDGDTYTLNIGLITADEVMYAGFAGSANNKYYLYNGQNYWTMSPYCWNGHANMFIVKESGFLSCVWTNDTGYGLRPVINLRSDVTFSGGDGTLNNPYIVS